eukprot:XP_028349435.1 uncharacterized protein LOC102982038 isoform X4 [Physeter catodon]
MSLLSDKAGEDGVYSVTYDEDSKFCILQTNYTEYIIFYLMNVNNNGSSAGTLRSLSPGPREWSGPGLQHWVSATSLGLQDLLFHGPHIILGQDL